jgi:hypothetical protein
MITNNVETENTTNNVETENTTNNVETENTTNNVETENTTNNVEIENTTNNVETENTTNNVETENTTNNVETENITNFVWDEYYKRTFEKSFINSPSFFAIFINDYIKSNNISINSIIDLGCGNGRDTIYFKLNNYVVEAIEQSKVACEYLNKYNINIYNQSIIDNLPKTYDMYYCRFVLHALNYEDIDKFFKNVYNSMSDNSIFCIETRSIKK